MKRKVIMRGCLIPVLILGMMALTGATDVFAHTDPPGAYSTGVSVSIVVFTADGATPAFPLQPLSECETVYVRATLARGLSPNDAAFEQGTWTITLPDLTIVDVTPPGGIPCVGGTSDDPTPPGGRGQCSGSPNYIDSPLIPYQVKPADVVGGSVIFRTDLTGAYAHLGDNDAPGVVIGAPSSIAVETCDDYLFCNGPGTCDPDMVWGDSNERLGGCRCENIPVCGDGVADPGEECGEPGLVCPDDRPVCNGCICQAPLCGDGTADPGEECGEPGLECPPEAPVCSDCQCIPAVCGNGALEPGEQCDVGFACPSDRPFCWGCQCVLSVDLEYFTATALDGSVKIDWRTGNEVDNLGFYVQRSDTEAGPYTRINGAMILANGSGSEYTYTDTDVENGRTYWYKLEDVDRYQGSTLHGPVSATPVASASTWVVASQAGASEMVQSQSVALNYLFGGTGLPLLFVSVWLGVVAYRRKR